MLLDLRTTLATVAMTALLALPAAAQTVDVLHYWTSGSESAAMRVFADAYKAKGGTWVDSAVGGFDDARASALNRIAGGNPPSVLLDNVGEVAAFANQGILSPVDPAIAAQLAPHLPALLVKRITVDGKLYAIPVDIGGGNWMWYSTKAFKDIGAQPPKTWDAFFAVADKLKAKGYVPLAFGGQPWQEASLFYNVMLAQGHGFYNQVMTNHDVKVAGGPAMLKTFETFRKLTAYVDQGSEGREWNDATAMIINNKAAIQIMGDWAKGEFLRAGKVPGKDFGCDLAPGTQNSYQMVVDLFDFPKVSKADGKAGQTLFESVVADPTVQAQFGIVKGSLPARNDVDIAKADMCMQLGEKTLQNPNSPVPNFEIALTADQEGQVKDLVSQFWTTPAMTAADATKQFASIIAQSND
ncbi:ABC transporter substrate-binding protein [Acidisoma cladoniae]|jgi:glucose/mannose transport system substrate-binding protein|uniref:ABC transporter substrate-binding protein n=1 Tax=Acidisoma cladoniae TaxID=3040935 RepID=UPI00254B7BC0|nr:ABC transporter substrate-binding protein [Acidisoma sp. PAMC 29798]